MLRTLPRFAPRSTRGTHCSAKTSNSSFVSRRECATQATTTNASDTDRSVCEQQDRGFEIFLQVLDVARGVPSIDDAVVAADRQVHALSADDVVAAEHRALDDLVGADDRDFGAVDHRGRRDSAERAKTGHGNRAATHFVWLEFVGARRCGKAADLARELPGER